jgi:ATP-dependent Lon protease
VSDEKSGNNLESKVIVNNTICDNNFENPIPLLPLRNIIIFPNMVIPLFVGREKSIKALEVAMKNKQNILLCAQKNAKTNNPSKDDIFPSGTVSTILQLLKLPDGTVRVLIEGKKRVTVTEIQSEHPYFLAAYEDIDDVTESFDLEIGALCRTLKQSFEEYLQHNKKIPAEVLLNVTSIEDPSKLIDSIIININSAIEKRQSILEMTSIKDRLEALYALIQSEIEIIKVEQKIKSRIEGQIEKNQKEYYLNEQMNAIQKELGDKDSKSEIFELEKELKAIKHISEESLAKVLKEIGKLKRMSPMSAEAAVVRNYVDWILSIPWDKETSDNKDIEKAEDILNADHYALDKVKERILEYLAVTTLVGKIKGSILCLSGPPGVGKTSLGESIARALGRKFVRVSLGGVRDEAEIRGHRRTYIGAMPGKIIQSMKKVGCRNPVFMLDEIDKMSMDFRGDPASALLEVLDPEQNSNFNDHYMEVDYDLSRVMFIATANSIHNIPRPLLDRMEVIHLHGYTDDEKYHIANRYLVNRQIENNGLKDLNIKFSQSTLYSIIRNYTKESGVRNLNREISSICRKVAKKVVSKKIKKISISTKSLVKLLGPPKFHNTTSESENTVGLVNGLAWTELGGEVLTVETSVLPGSGKLELTGKLGDVMQESAKAAFTYIRSKSEELGLEKDFHNKIDIHLHIPEGAIPKDGPSAGVTIVTCLASALLQTPVSNEIAMTGEITLRGRILPIGGLKEKVLAAHRIGIKTIYVPEMNKNDLQNIPANIKEDVDIVLVKHINELMSAKKIFPEKVVMKRSSPKLARPTTATRVSGNA